MPHVLAGNIRATFIVYLQWDDLAASHHRLPALRGGRVPVQTDPSEEDHQSDDIPAEPSQRRGGEGMGGYPHLLLCAHYRASASHFHAFHRELLEPLLLRQFLLVGAHLLHLFKVYNHSRPRDGEARQRAVAELLAGSQGPPQETGEDPVLRGEAGEIAHEGGERVQEALTRLIKNLSAPQHPELRILQYLDPTIAHHHVHRYQHPLRQSPPEPHLQRTQTHQ